MGKEFKRNRVPIKLIIGRQDSVNKKSTPDPLAKKIKEIEVLWIENYELNPMLESPKEWVKSVLKA
jgi:pimeloyl-ACP methyl ester carboxylesterase